MDYLTFMKENLSEIVIFAYFGGFEDGTSSDNFMSKFDKMWHFLGKKIKISSTMIFLPTKLYVFWFHTWKYFQKAQKLS